MNLQEKIERKNQNGEEPTDEPSEKLKNPPSSNRPKKQNRKSGFNSTAKDPNLGKRNPIER
ncbi:hypothetical protein [Rubrolithibacter danxiaensis]|uniref:hypothetical protein n=1 Tax=Rubrolithibacter danxiaensis TaxID=3390805 RepID=UPI003BF7F0A7